MKSKLSSFWQWVKRHWKIIVPITVAVLLAIILGCSIPACIAAKPNGTYYRVKSNGELDREDYFTLKSGTWTDTDGASGEYKKDGDRILFYIEFFGEKEILDEGTLSNYVLSFEDGNYISKKHKHRYGALETVEPTCVIDGKEERKCACGVKETKTIKAAGHSIGDWIFDYTSHWKECTKCKNKVEDTAHFGEDKCKICNFPLVDTVGLSYTLNNEDNTYTVKGIGSVKDKIIRIPATHDGLPVIGIGDNAFKDESITHIILPNSIRSISGSAFSGCSELKSITVASGNTKYIATGNCLIEKGSKTLILGCKNSIIPTDGSVTSIGDYAFRDCDSLTSINIPASVTSIGESAFRYCRGLESITVASGNTRYIGIGNCLIEKDSKKLISGCKNSVIPTDGSVTSIGDYAFSGCNGLTSITIHDSVTSIGDYAFWGCRNLTSITIPDSVTSIGDYAFYSCGLTSVTIGNSVTSIGDYAFRGCDLLTSLTIGNGVTSIDRYAFEGCSSLTSITIPNSVTSIGGSAFSGCSSLTSITIPNSVTSIGGSAFFGCNNLQYNEYDNAYYWGNTNNPYVVLVKAKSTDITSCTINENTKIIYYDAFRRCSSLTSISIPDSVTSIGDYAFSGCSGLTSITIPNSVTSIGNDAFDGCSSLQYNEYDNAYYLGNSTNPYLVLVEAESKNITSCTINENTKNIYYGAFSICSNLTSITIPDSVTSIGDYAFYKCNSLTSITIPDSVTSIGEYAFYNCYSLTSINFNGTKAQWDAIDKADDWSYGAGNYTIHCTDGDITKNDS